MWTCRLENCRASKRETCSKVSIIIVWLCTCSRCVTGLLTTQEVSPLFVYFSLDTGFLSSNGKPSSSSSSIGDKIGTDLKQELRATVNIGTVLTIVTMLHWVPRHALLLVIWFWTSLKTWMWTVCWLEIWAFGLYLSILSLNDRGLTGHCSQLQCFLDVTETMICKI